MKPGYKQTEVGVIPEDWEVVRLDEVARRASGHTPDKSHPEYWDGPIKWVSLQDTARLDRGYIRETAQTITQLGIDNSSARMLPPETVVLSRDAGVGRCAVMFESMAVSQHFMAWTCGSRLHHWYLYYSLRSQRRELERIAMGNTIKTIGLPFFREFQVALPSTHEQRAIAEALSDADALIESLEGLIAKKRQIKQGAMQELLTGKRRLPGFSGEWETRLLGQLADIRSGGTPATGRPEFWDGGVPWCTPTDITRLAGKYLATTERTISALGLSSSSAELLPVGTVVMTSRATIGECALTRVPIATNQGFKNFVCGTSCDAEFLYYRLQTETAGFIRLCGGSTFLEIGKRQLVEYAVEIPPSVNEQRAIAAVLSDLDTELEALDTKLDKARAIKQGMMQELLTGRTRLVPAEVS